MKKTMLIFTIILMHFIATANVHGASSNSSQTLDVTFNLDTTLYFNGIKDLGGYQGQYNNGTTWVPKTMVINGTTYVPLRYFSNQLGISNDKIGWDEASHSIWVNSEKPTDLKNSEQVSNESTSSQSGKTKVSTILININGTVYPDISLYFNGVKDTLSTDNPGFYNNGTSWVPKTMIYRGTTYVPIRYFANQLGIANDNIGWDEASHSIWVGSIKPNEVPVPTPTAVPTPTPIPREFPSETKSGTGIYGVALEQTADEVRAQFGEPNRIYPYDYQVTNKAEYWIYNNRYKQYFRLFMQDDKVQSIETFSPTWKFNNITPDTTHEELCSKGIVGYDRLDEPNHCYFYAEKLKGEYQIMLDTIGRSMYPNIDGIHKFQIMDRYIYDDGGGGNIKTKVEREKAIVQNVFDAVNVVRTLNGLNPLVLNNEASGFAKDHNLELLSVNHPRNKKGADIHGAINGDSKALRMSKIAKSLGFVSADENVSDFDNIKVKDSFYTVGNQREENVYLNKKAKAMGIDLQGDYYSPGGFRLTIIVLS